MIQVVNRVFSLLEILHTEGPLPLRTLAELANLKKTTVHNIVNTLVNIGVMENIGNGVYTLGSAIKRLANVPVSTEKLLKLSSIHVGRLGRELNETVLLVQLKGTNLAVIIEHQPNQAIVISPDAYHDGPVYEWASGHVLLACASVERVELILSSLGIPSPEAWPETGGTRAGLDKILARIRSQGYAQRTSISSVVSMAVPVQDSGGAVIAALSVCLPRSRWEEDNGKQILSKLRVTAEQVHQTLVEY